MIVLTTIILTGCSSLFKNKVVEQDSPDESNTAFDDNTVYEEQQKNTLSDRSVTETITTEIPYSFFNPEGTNLTERINAPNGFTRIPSESSELTGFIRELPLKEDGSKILLYDKTEKGNQDNHVAVFELSVGNRDLQQCADSAMRIYAEYLWSIGAYDRIAFHLTNGFLMEYSKWRDGYRIEVKGNNVSWVNTQDYDATSYECFKEYLEMVFAYAGTLSLSYECTPVENINDIRPGDLFLQGGSPGHCVMVVDIAKNSDGELSFLLAQGYLPAQDFHVLKNPLHPKDPWYYSSELNYPLITPSWTFDEGSLVRWSNFPLSSSDSLSTLSDYIITSNEETKQEVTILAVGDNLVHTQVVESGLQEDGSYQFDHLFAHLKEDISAADIAIINQETILGGDDFPYTGYPSFNSPTEIGDAIFKAGFDVVLHATNHTMDMGSKGVENTLAFWKQYPDILLCGISESNEDRDSIPILEKNGIKFAMLNYTYGLNGYKVPEAKPYLVNLIDKDAMAEDIKQAKELADFIIVFPHWGTEYVYEPTNEQEELVDFFYEQGVDLILGTHPHVIEPVEWIEDSPEHKMLVYYSLGNYVSYQKEAPRMLGGMATITITKDESGTYISKSDITPIITHYENGPSDYNYGVYKLSDYTEEQALVHGVLELEQKSIFTLDGTYSLAKQVLGPWFY
jgi:poly-gamma-glutamate synthesis protein (capsule biosynthesis protein)